MVRPVLLLLLLAAATCKSESASKEPPHLPAGLAECRHAARQADYLISQTTETMKRIATDTLKHRDLQNLLRKAEASHDANGPCLRVHSKNPTVRACARAAGDASEVVRWTLRVPDAPTADLQRTAADAAQFYLGEYEQDSADCF